jgi:hypothetical protein
MLSNGERDETGQSHSLQSNEKVYQIWFYSGYRISFVQLIRDHGSYFVGMIKYIYSGYNFGFINYGR